MAKGLIGNFEKMSDLNGALDRLDKSLNSPQDWETVEKVAHKLKGSFGYRTQRNSSLMLIVI